ncbi:MAG: hypothetical protein IKD76_06350 [Clostridia bacterium]|nr:hypothetical protein [Clostridia bacterium]MBR3209780.1 hypothetical protein [Bacilli bacterium]
MNMKSIYMTLMVVSMAAVLVILGIVIGRKPEEKLENDKMPYETYKDLEIVKQFNTYNYDANITYYKEKKETNKTKYWTMKYTYKNNIERFSDDSNNPYEYNNFVSKERYIKAGNKEDKDAYKIEKLTYKSYHSMILEVLNNSKYDGKTTYVLQTPKEVIKKFLEEFNKRVQSSIKYNEKQEYKLYIKVENEEITEFVLTADNKHIAFIFSNINKIEDITLPKVA